MRSTCKCPKCRHHNIFYLPLVKAGASPLMAYTTPSGIIDTPFVAYVCEKCGYAEFYVTDPSKVHIANIPGGRLIRGVPEWEDDPAGD
jgi:predicted nucleic-acid-binding Zn-ribbon protein